MAHSKSVGSSVDGWCWPVPEGCPRELQAIVSNLNQARVYVRRAVEGSDASCVWKRVCTTAPSIGNLLLHLRGTEHQWIGNKLGGLPLRRNRDEEFSKTGGPGIGELLRELECVAAETNAILARMTAADVKRTDFDGRFSASFILNYTAQHFAYHAGQLVLTRKIHEPAFKLFP